MSFNDTMALVDSAPAPSPYTPKSIPAPSVAPAATSDIVRNIEDAEQKKAVRKNLFVYKAPGPLPAQAYLSGKKEKMVAETPMPSSPFIQKVEAASNEVAFPDVQRTIPSATVTRMREDFGGNDDLVVKKLYKNDPKFRAEFDRYADGEMQNLPQEFQDNFSTFILNSHYFNDLSTEIPGNIDYRRDPTRKGEGFVNFVRNALATPIVFGVGGVADAAQGFIDDFSDMATAYMFPGQLQNSLKNTLDRQQDNDNGQSWARRINNVINPDNSLENVQLTAATQAQIAASFLPGPMGYALSGMAGAARDMVADKQAGEDPSLITGAAGALKGAGSQFVGNKIAGNFNPTIANPSSVLGRITNAATKGAGVGFGVGATTNSVDAVTGRKTVKEAVIDTGASTLMGAGMAAGFQTAFETPNILRSGYTKLTGYSKLPAAKQYTMAVQQGGEEAKQAMTKGVAPKDAVFLQDASSQERDIYGKVHAIVKDIVNNPRSTSNVQLPQGELVGDKIREVISQQNKAGQAIGAIRDNFSDDVKLDVNGARNAFVDFLAKMGVSTTGGKLGAEGSLLDPQAVNALAMVWSKLPQSGTASQAQVDDVIRAINDVIQATDIDESAARMGMGVLKSNLRDTLANSLSDDVKPGYLQATKSYAETMEVLRAAKKALPFTGRIGSQYSLSQFKQDVLSGELDLRAGQLSKALSSDTEGTVAPFFDKLERLTDNQVYVTRPNGTQALVPNPDVSPYATKTFDAKTQNVVEYVARMRQMLQLQKTTSFGGEIKGATVGLSPSSWLNWSKGLFKDTPLTVFNAQDEYLNSLQAGQLTPVANPSAAAKELMDDVQVRRSQMLEAVKQSRNPSGANENRLLHMTGENKGVPGLDFPAAPPDLSDEIPLSQMSTQGVADAGTTNAALNAGASYDDALAAAKTGPQTDAATMASMKQALDAKMSGAADNVDNVPLNQLDSTAKATEALNAVDDVPLDQISMYHVTSAENAKSIQANGFKPQIGERSMGVANAKGTWLYSDKSSTSEFGKNFKSPATIETKVSGKIFDAMNDDKSIRALVEDSELISKLKKDGYVGIKGDEMGAEATFIFDPKSITPVSPSPLPLVDDVPLNQMKVYRGGTMDGKSFSTSEDVAASFAKERGGSVKAYVISPKAKIIDIYDIPTLSDQKAIFERASINPPFGDAAFSSLESKYKIAEKWAIDNGYDAVKLPTEGEIRVVNKKVLLPE